MPDDGANPEADEESLRAMLLVTAYCACLWTAGQVCKRIRVSAAIGEIVVGVILGPQGLDVVPHADVFELAGVFGVTLLVFESGLHVSFDAMKAVGTAAAGVAVLGSLLPLASSIGVAYAVSAARYPPWPTGLAIGVALAPTSVGLAIKMLKEANRLMEREGQLIMAAAFLDDVLSLVLLTVLLQVGLATRDGGALSAWPALRPIVLASAFCTVAVGLGAPVEPDPARGRVLAALGAWVGAVPRALARFLPPTAAHTLSIQLRDGRGSLATAVATAHAHAADSGPPAAAAPPAAASGEPWADAHEVLPTVWPTRPPPWRVPSAQEQLAAAKLEFDRRSLMLLCLMLATLVGYSVIGDAIGSHLLGAFLAGASFAAVPGALGVWRAQVKRIGAWLIRCFFGGTVAFAVPIRAMLTARAFGVGMLLCAGPACLGKLIGAVAAGRRDMLLVGAAMLGRGEFGLLVAQKARSALLNPAPTTFAAHAHALRLEPAPSGGGWCLDGDCGGARAAAATREPPEAFERGGAWCAHCAVDADGVERCDAEPRRGERYWQVGADCDAWPDACECASMMSADAFSVTMWAIVVSSLASPICFRLSLRAHSRSAERPGTQQPPGGGATPGSWLPLDTELCRGSPYLRADLMI